MKRPCISSARSRSTRRPRTRGATWPSFNSGAGAAARSRERLSQEDVMGRLRVVLIATAALAVSIDTVSAQTASRVIRLIDQRCANCHRLSEAARPPEIEGAPELATLRQMAPETILQALTK